MMRPHTSLAARTFEELAMSAANGVRLNGAVKFYNEDRGFGFIKRDDGQDDVFVHVTSLRASKVRDLVEGDRVTFELVDGPKGKGHRAANVKLA